VKSVPCEGGDQKRVVILRRRPRTDDGGGKVPGPLALVDERGWEKIGTRRRQRSFNPLDPQVANGQQEVNAGKELGGTGCSHWGALNKNT